MDKYCATRPSGKGRNEGIADDFEIQGATSLLFRLENLCLPI